MPSPLFTFLAGSSGSTLTLILAGVAVSAFTGALTSFALNMSPNPFASLEIVFWLMGSLADRSMDHVWLAVPFILIGCVLLFSSWQGAQRGKSWRGRRRLSWYRYKAYTNPVDHGHGS